MTNYTQDNEGRVSPGKVVCWRARDLFGIGAMLMISCLLFACGSESKQSSSVSGKDKTVVKSRNASANLNLMVDNKTGPGKIKKEPAANNAEIYPGSGVTVREVDERVAANRKLAESPNYEVLPGVTRRELETRIEANRKRTESPTYQVLPGITRAELDAKIAANRKRTESPTSEVLPGITRVELEARIAASMKRNDSPNREVLPGLTKDQLDAIVQSGRK